MLKNKILMNCLEGAAHASLWLTAIGTLGALLLGWDGVL